MKQIVTVIFVGWVGALAWVVIDTLSADAVAMGLGVMLGVLAGIPLALLLLAAGRRSAGPPLPPGTMQQPPHTMQQPPVIMMGRPRGELPTPSPRYGVDRRLPDHRIDGPGQRRRYVDLTDGHEIEDW